MAYVTLADFKVFLDEVSSERDNELLAALASAERMVDRFLGRSLGQATVTERVPGTGASVIFPPRTPITAVTACTVDGTAVEVTFTDIEVRRRDGGLFPASANIQLSYTAGLATIPEDVKTATMITAQAIFGAGDLDANMTGENIAGGVAGAYQPGGPGSLPPAAQTILGPLRRIHP